MDMSGSSDADDVPQLVANFASLPFSAEQVAFGGVLRVILGGWIVYWKEGDYIHTENNPALWNTFYFYK